MNEFNQAGCEGKHRFDSRKLAQDVSRRSTRSKHAHINFYRCEFCGAAPWECRGGWQPNNCTGECGKGWRDPDHEYEKMRDEG